MDFGLLGFFFIFKYDWIGGLFLSFQVSLLFKKPTIKMNESLPRIFDLDWIHEPYLGKFVQYLDISKTLSALLLDVRRCSISNVAVLAPHTHCPLKYGEHTVHYTHRLKPEVMDLTDFAFV